MFKIFSYFIGILFIFGLTLCPPVFCGRKELDDVTSVATQCVQSISQQQQIQLEQVKQFVNIQKKAGQATQLILGAKNWISDSENAAEERRRFFSKGNWIFFNDFGHDPSGLPYIEGDFNNLELLNQMAQHLSGSLDYIIVDDETYKFTKWSKAHVNAFIRMLKPSGVFSYCPDRIDYVTDLQVSLSETNEIMDFIVNEFNDKYPQDVFPHAYFVIPFIECAPEEDFSIDEKELSQLEEQYKPFQAFLHLNDDEFENLYTEKEEFWKIRPAYEREVVKDPLVLRKNIIEDKLRESKKEIITNKAFKEVLLPRAKSFLLNFFELVQVEEGIPYPVPSNQNLKGLRTIIIARNPKTNP